MDILLGIIYLNSNGQSTYVTEYIWNLKNICLCKVLNYLLLYIYIYKIAKLSSLIWMIPNLSILILRRRRWRSIISVIKSSLAWSIPPELLISSVWIMLTTTINIMLTTFTIMTAINKMLRSIAITSSNKCTVSIKYSTFIIFLSVFFICIL